MSVIILRSDHKNPLPLCFFIRPVQFILTNKNRSSVSHIGPRDSGQTDVHNSLQLLLNNKQFSQASDIENYFVPFIFDCSKFIQITYLDKIKRSQCKIKLLFPKLGSLISDALKYISNNNL